MKLDIKKLFLSILMCQLTGVFGSLFTYRAIDAWYVTLIRPSFAPPNWLFGPAWLTLYTLMGISFYLIWMKGFKGKSLHFFTVQLVLNALWSFSFFGLKNPFYGLVNILALLVFIILTMLSFYKIDKRAAWLFVPYLAWVGFATALNYFIFVLN